MEEVGAVVDLSRLLREVKPAVGQAGLLVLAQAVVGVAAVPICGVELARELLVGCGGEAVLAGHAPFDEAGLAEDVLLRARVRPADVVRSLEVIEPRVIPPRAPLRPGSPPR